MPVNIIMPINIDRYYDNELEPIFLSRISNVYDYIQRRELAGATSFILFFAHDYNLDLVLNLIDKFSSIKRVVSQKSSILSELPKHIDRVYSPKDNCNWSTFFFKADNNNDFDSILLNGLTLVQKPISILRYCAMPMRKEILILEFNHNIYAEMREIALLKNVLVTHIFTNAPAALANAGHLLRKYGSYFPLEMYNNNFHAPLDIDFLSLFNYNITRIREWEETIGL